MFSGRNDKIYTQTHSLQMLETYRIGVNKIVTWILTWILVFIRFPSRRNFIRYSHFRRFVREESNGQRFQINVESINGSLAERSRRQKPIDRLISSIGRGIKLYEKQEVGGFGHAAGISKRKTRNVGLWIVQIIDWEIINNNFLFDFLIHFKRSINKICSTKD